MRQQRAFVLLSTMLVILVLGMVVRVAILRFPASLGLAGHSSTQERAARAAQSGLDYAVTQLRLSPNWKGGVGHEVAVDHPGVLKVIHDDGNVVGTVWESDGTSSEFRIRFNHQDGNSQTAGDQRPDPRELFTMPYVSVNNLLHEEEALVPRGTEGPYNAVRESPEGFEIPGMSACLFVEGRVLNDKGDVLAKSTASTTFFLDSDNRVDDAVVMAGGDLDIKVDKKVHLGGKMVKRSSDQLLRLRTKQEVNIVNAQGGSAKITVKDEARGEITHGAHHNGPTVTNKKISTAIDSNSDFYNLPWESVPKAAEDRAIELPGGVYVYGEFGGPVDTRSVRYFDTDYETFYENSHDPAFLQTGVNVSDMETFRNDVKPGQIAEVGQESLNLVESYDPTKSSTKFSETDGYVWQMQDIDVKVKTSVLGQQGLALIPEVATPFTHKEDSQGDFSQDDGPYKMKMMMTNSTLSAEGDVILYGGITGKGGTVTSGGEIRILAARLSELSSTKRSEKEVAQELDEAFRGEDSADDPRSDPTRLSNLHLNLYARKNVTISTFSPRINGPNSNTPVKGYRDLVFKGLLYSWGDVEVITSPTGDSKLEAGIFDLRGSLVAYGNDPKAKSPGGTTSESGDALGKVRIRAKKAVLAWDPRFLALKMLQGGDSNIELRRGLVSYPER